MRNDPAVQELTAFGCNNAGCVSPSCAREETRESRGMPCLFLNTERVLGGKPPKKSGFRRHLAGSKIPEETFFTAISRWKLVSRRARCLGFSAGVAAVSRPRSRHDLTQMPTARLLFLVTIGLLRVRSGSIRKLYAGRRKSDRVTEIAPSPNQVG